MELVSVTTSTEILEELTSTTKVMVSKREDNSSLDEGDKERSVSLSDVNDVERVNREELQETSNGEDTSKNTTSDTNTNVSVSSRRELPDSKLRGDGTADTSGAGGEL